MIITTSKGKSVDSKFTTIGDAARFLQKAVDSKKVGKSTIGFAQSLLRSFGVGRLSHDQSAWIHILATELKEEEVNRAYEPIDAFQINLIFSIATTKGLKSPRVRLCQGRIAIRFGRRTGKVEVVRVGNPSTILGTITEHQLHFNGRAQADEVEAVAQFARDPQGTAVMLGQATGSCIFCGLRLTTAESVGSGYGPICAGNYGLEWFSSEGARRERGMRDLLKLKEKILNEAATLPPDVAAALLPPSMQGS